MVRTLLKSLILGLVLVAANPALAQLETQNQVRFPCGAGMVELDGGGFIKAAFTLADVTANKLSLTFIGHASFLIRSPRGVKVITDYNDYFRAQVLPDIATMNIDRGNHATEDIDPSIRYVLRGWDQGHGIAPPRRYPGRRPGL